MDGGHAPRLGIRFGKAHQRAPETGPARAAFVGHEVVDMQMRTAGKRVDRPHAQDANESAGAKGADELVAGIWLPLAFDGSGGTRPRSECGRSCTMIA